MSLAIPVTDASAVGSVRRAAHGLGEEIPLSEDVAGTLALIATELATNLSRHATDGVVLIRRIEDDGPPGIELLAVDKGPGIHDVARAMRDGFSTGGTSGSGLGAIHRLASEFDIYTRPQNGTVLVARVRASTPATFSSAKADSYQHGVVCLPYPHETVCGDGWLVRRTPSSLCVALVDGLGHGPDAAHAASEALRAIRETVAVSPAEIVRAVQGPLRATRGAALAVAVAERGSGSVRFAGIGNISATIVGPTGSRALASHNGIVGHEIRTIQEFVYEWPPTAHLVLHSDGISARWRLDAYPGLVMRAPAIVAGILHRDFVRARDDATILVVRDGPR